MREPFNAFLMRPQSAGLHLTCLFGHCSYIKRTQTFRQTDQLFVCYGRSTRGLAVSHQWLAHWVVWAIRLAYIKIGNSPIHWGWGRLDLGNSCLLSTVQGCFFTYVQQQGLHTDICMFYCYNVTSAIAASVL